MRQEQQNYGNEDVWMLMLYYEMAAVESHIRRQSAMHHIDEGEDGVYQSVKTCEMT